MAVYFNLLYVSQAYKTGQAVHSKLSEFIGLVTDIKVTISAFNNYKPSSEGKVEL